MSARQNKLNSFRNTSTIIMSQTMKLVGSSCLFIVAVFCAVAGSAEVTVAGENCATNHRCGKHGYNYVWCYTSTYQKEWDYCCKPDHPCDTYGCGYHWCYYGCTQFSWSYCDTEGVPGPTLKLDQKTVGGKACVYGESCGQHGYSYYWCHLENGSWDFCCNPDHTCATHGKSYSWCWGGYWSTSWQYCEA